MGAYAYCNSCEDMPNGFDNPSPEEIAKGHMICLGCGTEYYLDESTKVELISKMASDIEKLKKVCKMMGKEVEKLRYAVRS